MLGVPYDQTRARLHPIRLMDNRQMCGRDYI
jgi:hypothetical protein